MLCNVLIKFSLFFYFSVQVMAFVPPDNLKRLIRQYYRNHGKPYPRNETEIYRSLIIFLFLNHILVLALFFLLNTDVIRDMNCKMRLILCFAVTEFGYRPLLSARGKVFVSWIMADVPIPVCKFLPI